MAVIHQWLMQYVTEQLAPSTSRQCLINELHAEAGNRKYRQSISFSLLESLLIQTRHEPLELWKAKIIPENVFDLDFDGFNDSIHSSWKPLISISIGHFHFIHSELSFLCLVNSAQMVSRFHHKALYIFWKTCPCGYTSMKPYRAIVLSGKV